MKSGLLSFAVAAACLCAAASHAATASPGKNPAASPATTKAPAASPADVASDHAFIESARLAAAADDYGAAESDYRRALQLEEKLYGRDAVAVGETLAELGLLASNQGRFSDAADLFRRARPIIEASANEDERAKLDSYMALDAANARNFSTALAYAEQATAAREAELEAANGSDAQSNRSGNGAAQASRGELAHSLRVEAEMALRQGQLARARASAEESLWIVSEEPGLPLWWRADTVALMGEVNEAQGRVVQAERDFRDARDLDAHLFGDTAPTALADITLGEFYTRQQLYPAALDAFHAGLAIAKKDRVTRSELQPDDIAGFVAADTAGDTDQHKHDAEIFQASQYSEAGTADRAIARMAAQESVTDAGLSDLIGRAQQAERDRDLAQIELAAEYAKLDEERNAAREQQLADNVKLASATADSLVAKVKESFPRYTSIAEPDPADLADVQKTLAPDEALLVYVIGTDSSYALVARRDSFTATPLAVRRWALKADIADLRRSLSTTLGRTRDFSLRNANALYMQLIAPVRSQLAGVNHLIVVPGSALSSLPLGLLVGQAPENRGDEHNYAQADWLVRHYAISDVPSARAFLSLRTAQTHRTASRPFLGLAPAFTGASQADKALADVTNGCRENGPISPSLLRALPPLPGADAEVRTIAARLGNNGSTVLVGPEASEANFRAEPLDQYAVIYFATHGLLPGELHCASEPALALAPPAQAATSARDDGLLNASEVAQLNLKADLVVLSACNTATDPNALGGGSLEGLSDAFFVAGARAVLASHWEISSASATALMTELFGRAGGGAGTAEALREAQLSLISAPSTAHPFHWAAFTLIGDGRTPTASTRTAETDRAKRP